MCFFDILLLMISCMSMRLLRKVKVLRMIVSMYVVYSSIFYVHIFFIADIFIYKRKGKVMIFYGNTDKGLV